MRIKHIVCSLLLLLICGSIVAQSYQKERDLSTTSQIHVKSLVLSLAPFESAAEAKAFVAILETYPEIHSYELKKGKCSVLIQEASGQLYEQLIAKLNQQGYGAELAHIRHNQTFTLTRVEDHKVKPEITEEEYRKQQGLESR